MTTKTDSPSLVDLAVLNHENSKSKGFYDGWDMTQIKDQLAKIGLIHSEPSEVLEALRKEKGSHEVVKEICDSIIRILDFYAALVDAGVVHEDLDDVMEQVMEANRNRPHMHSVLA
jgi:NTP pyrophosphatase (non-canonical NTP hydrolase)